MILGLSIVCPHGFKADHLQIAVEKKTTMPLSYEIDHIVQN